jgi:hypothetical protein
MPTFKNARAQDGLPICPLCGTSIAVGDDAGADGAFMLHLGCWRRHGDQGPLRCKACGEGVVALIDLVIEDSGPYHRRCARSS